MSRAASILRIAWCRTSSLSALEYSTLIASSRESTQVCESQSIHLVSLVSVLYMTSNMLVISFNMHLVGGYLFGLRAIFGLLKLCLHYDLGEGGPLRSWRPKSQEYF